MLDQYILYYNARVISGPRDKTNYSDLELVPLVQQTKMAGDQLHAVFQDTTKIKDRINNGTLLCTSWGKTIYLRQAHPLRVQAMGTQHTRWVPRADRALPRSRNSQDST
ncbi:hypothetical protein PoB_000627200 [Plakobranchus ocellatus]|uniref:Uncharacterized protein n=1 Tax=Plakobranchus ocellatus TaxID=259542 RepID=A0AAV3YBE9_9GAST|nr:hypothetical protein PoB_000627200 [Plakobranchus ocellatus]